MADKSFSPRAVRLTGKKATGSGSIRKIKTIKAQRHQAFFLFVPWFLGG
jgi:hypothetical protein